MGYAGQLIVERSAEELLLEFERTGRPEPFEEIVRRYSGMVYHVCHRICRDKHDAEDATQAVFAALAVGRKKESGEIRTIGPWLRQVARRVSLDIRRGKKRRQRRETLCASDGASEDPGPEPSAAGLDAEEVKQLVKEELERMPVKYRLPLILHYFGGMTQDDMAKELGCRPGTLRVRLHRARNMLAKRLAKRGVAVGSGLGAVVFVVAVTRAVQSAVTDSLTVQFGYGHAATAGGVIQAAGGGPLAAVHGVAASKLKVACALVLIGACVVRAGAEVYEYIRPLQLHVPVPVNLDQLVKPLFDTLMPPMRVDAPPAQPGGASKSQAEIAVTEVLTGGPLLEHRPVPVATVPVVGDGIARSVETARMAPGPIAAMPAGAGLQTVGIARPLGRLGPDYSQPRPWAAAPAWMGAGSGGVASGSSGALPLIARRPTVPSVPTIPAPSKSGSGNGSATPSLPPVTPPLPESVPNTPSVPVDPPPVAQQTPPNQQIAPPPATGGSSGGSPPETAVAIVINPTPPVAPSATLQGMTRGANADQTSAAFASTGTVSSSWSAYAFSMSAPQASLTVASSVSYDSVQFAVPVPPATRSYRVEDRGLSGSGKVAAASVDNSGIVTASASAGPVAALDLSEVPVVTNSVDNPVNGRNGWYAGPKGKLVLPKIPVEPGTHSYSWGEDPTDATPDLVNSVRLTLHDVLAAGDVRMSLVAPDWPGVPTIPAGQRVLGIWALDADATAAGGIDVLVRFDAYQLFQLGGTDQNVQLLDYRNGWRTVDDNSFVTLPDQHIVGGRLGDVTYFAITLPTTPSAVHLTSLAIPTGTFAAITPEPACLSLIAGGMFLLSRRRRVNM